MTRSLSQSILIELAQIDQLFTTYNDLLMRVQQQAPDAIQLAALATVLHSFYNGIEGVFLSIAHQLDHQVPDSIRWHRALLTQMAQPRAARPAVLSPLLEAQLTDYLAFRHYFRHAYAFTLDWARLEPLVRSLAPVHSTLRHELEAFLQFLATQPSRVEPL